MMSVDYRLEATEIMDQRKTFYKRIIPESTCGRKETANTELLVTSRNGERKIMQSIKVASRPPSRKGKWNQLSQSDTSTK